eukprot:CAMPEP_0113679228 /NCGR_PEP_ID=MMETSP0038_2-20120614/10481_1 /TAXON_ID=2898 /ORGANISM="Cryptomonas paramecium" /LENGTH=73 /DNA_ID=CAMNT_0000597143 /DNA_START=46 /DNA_END=263 /DNA_ORIENTATION=+ /assembly_acc=CAM_ASM_000170
MPKFQILHPAGAHRVGTVVAYYPSPSDDVHDDRLIRNIIRELDRLIPPVEQYEDPFARFPVRECIRSLVQHAR